MIRSAVRIALVSLAIGWLASLVFALYMARLQYLEIYDNRIYNVPRTILLPNLDPRWHIFDPATIFVPNRVAAEYEWRIVRKLTVGPALLLPQMLIVSAVLSWQIMHTLRRNRYNPLHFGVVTGGLVGIVQVITLLALQTMPPLAIAEGALMIGIGLLAATTAPTPASNPEPAPQL